MPVAKPGECVHEAGAVFGGGGQVGANQAERQCCVGRSRRAGDWWDGVARFCRHAPGDRWFADETYVKVSGRWTYLYRAIDQHGQVVDGRD